MQKTFFFFCVWVLLLPLSLASIPPTREKSQDTQHVSTPFIQKTSDAQKSDVCVITISTQDNAHEACQSCFTKFVRDGKKWWKDKTCFNKSATITFLLISFIDVAAAVVTLYSFTDAKIADSSNT